MQKILLPIVIIISTTIAGCANNTPTTPLPDNARTQTSNPPVSGPSPASSTVTSVLASSTPVVLSPTGLAQPLDRAGERVTKKPFGIYITPANSPVPNEKFTGYHTGTDFEILPGEEDTDVPVFAICTGKLFASQFVNGYGGVIVESCTIDNQAVTVLYGHIRLTSVTTGAGDELKTGSQIAVLGQGGTRETDGERKHLHLGIHKGEKIDYRGYVQSRAELDRWLDYELLN